jgi:hypothetical protein
MAHGHSIPAAPATSSAVATAVVAALPWGLALKLVVLAVLAISAVVGVVATAIIHPRLMLEELRSAPASS